MAHHSVAVLGARGYLGRTLLRLAADHPHIQVAVAGSTSHAGTPFGDAVPALAGLGDLRLTDPAPADLAGLDGTLLALPHEASADLVPDLLAAGADPVVDLSGAHRLADPQARADAYGAIPDPPTSPVYGLPEAPAPGLPDADLVANPGCYPTGALLAALPLLQVGRADTLHVASASGATGAGSTPGPRTHFPEAHGSVTAYDVASHRHQPEIAQEASRLAGHPVTVRFVPHLAPLNRGIHTTVIAPGAADGLDGDALDALYDKVLDPLPFVRPVDHPPDPQHVRGTNVLEVRPAVRGDDAIVVAAHDNLVKGGAGTALQNLNLLLGLPQEAGLPTVGGAP